MAIDIEKVIDGRIEKPLKVKIILWPRELWEFGHGCEDPPSRSSMRAYICCM